VTFGGSLEGGCFRGIPFASAPEGPLRFLPPVPAAAWEGVRDAVAFGTAPPQAAPAPGVPPAWRSGDGLDCLTVNVWSPDQGAAGLPVMVWVYGGMWKIGSSGMPQYDAAAPVQAQIGSGVPGWWTSSYCPSTYPIADEDLRAGVVAVVQVSRGLVGGAPRWRPGTCRAVKDS
jgi:hypothetical protein